MSRWSSTCCSSVVRWAVLSIWNRSFRHFPNVSGFTWSWRTSPGSEALPPQSIHGSPLHLFTSSKLYFGADSAPEGGYAGFLCAWVRVCVLLICHSGHPLRCLPKFSKQSEVLNEPQPDKSDSRKRGVTTWNGLYLIRSRKFPVGLSLPLSQENTKSGLIVKTLFKHGAVLSWWHSPCQHI